LPDYISYIVYLYSLKTFNGSKWANRVENKLTFDDVPYVFEQHEKRTKFSCMQG